MSFVIILILTAASWYLVWFFAKKEAKTYDGRYEFPVMISLILGVSGGIAVFIMSMVIITTHVGLDATAAAYQEKYDSLVYQLESGMYNDNIYDKRDLMKSIEKWNVDLARKQTLAHDPWLGIFNPDIYDQFEFIDYQSVE